MSDHPHPADLDGIRALGTVLADTIARLVAGAETSDEARAKAATRLRQLAGALALLDEAERYDHEAAIREAIDRTPAGD